MNTRRNNPWRRLARDEAGSVNSAELVMIITLLAIGLIVGMKSFRDSAVTEFADLAQAFANLNQTYSISAVTVDLGTGGTITTASSSFTDAPDFCDQTTDVDTDPLGADTSKCVTVCSDASSTADDGETGVLP